ncbi:MAG: sugar ABC transporter permease [Anaerolineae bacterium]|nr:sugar ABC transporter permease [Anaerolineae bacterium]
MTTQRQSISLQLGRRRRILVENLTAYAFLLPAGILIFVFGIFPLIFAFFVSLNRWRRFPDEYVGIQNYQRALGDFAYVLFFWLGLALLIWGGLWLIRAVQREVIQKRQWRGLALLIVGGVNAAAALLFIQWFSRLLPAVLNIPRELRGQDASGGLFVSKFIESFSLPEVQAAGGEMLAAVVIGSVLSGLAVRGLRLDSGGGLLWRFSAGWLLLTVGGLTLDLVLRAIQAAAEAAQSSGTELPIGFQVVVISAGAGLMLAAYALWRFSIGAASDRRLLLGGMAAAALVVGGYALVAEAPRMLASADRDMLEGFSVTIMYSLGSVPIQLAVGLGLAYLLFQKVKGKTLFRMIFFLPYIMPFIATSMVFTLLFSHRQDSIINHLVGFFGVPPQKWLLEPTGIGRLLFGPQIPDWLAGPGLALVVIIIYTVWTYAGYATVVFLAGLGNISGELYEAARIDGASGWGVFRYITLPLLSPTTFFLSLVATIGTFQAFTQLWVMRTPASTRAVDTVSIYIFERITDASPNYGYGAALSFVLFMVILALTFIQNRVAARRVFYG